MTASGPESPLPAWLPLWPGEQVLFAGTPSRRARLGSMVLSLGLFELWRRRSVFAVTTRRVIAVRGLVSRERQVVPVDDVDEVNVRRSAWSATVFVATVDGRYGTQPFGPMDPGGAAAFAAAVHAAAGRPPPADGSG